MNHVLGQAFESQRYEREQWHSKDPLVRLEALKGLKPGWDGWRALPLSQTAIDNYLAFYEAVAEKPDPRLFPLATPHGGIRIEWECDGYDFIMDFEEDGRMWICALCDEDIEMDFERDELFDLDEALKFFNQKASEALEAEHLSRHTTEGSNVAPRASEGLTEASEDTMSQSRGS